MNLVDLLAIALFVVAVILGYRSGALPQIGGLAGAIGGAALAILVLPFLEPYLVDLEPQWRAVAVVLGLVAFVAAGEAIGAGAGRSLTLTLGRSVLGTIDRVAGSVVGVAQVILVIWLAGGLLAGGPLPGVASQVQNSVAVRTLNDTLPPATEVAADLGRLLDAAGLPDVFIGLEPLPAPPVDRPTDPEAARIAAAAEASTVRIVARTCNVQSTGSGFVARSGYVVTNAHVVAGASVVRVNAANQVADARTVLFDSQLDLAVLYVPDLAGPALRFATPDPSRGDVGAALGFPGGAGLIAEPAAVASSYDARGRDIYGDRTVSRRILELRARIERGDSGGPFVLADGTVGGVVFAESRTDEDVGYAIAASVAAVTVQPAFGRTTAVSTGPCLS